MVSKDQGRRTSHRNRDHCWVTRAAACSSQQDLATADSHHPAILPCSTLHSFSLEIIHTAFKAFKSHETFQNWSVTILPLHGKSKRSQPEIHFTLLDPNGELTPESLDPAEQGMCLTCSIKHETSPLQLRSCTANKMEVTDSNM